MPSNCYQQVKIYGQTDFLDSDVKVDKMDIPKNRVYLLTKMGGDEKVQMYQIELGSSNCRVIREAPMR